MKINKKGLLAGLAGLGLIGVGVYNLTKKNGGNEDIETDITEDYEDEEDEVEDSDES